MTASEVVFDSWAWWEVLGSTIRGKRFRRRYLRNPHVRVHTSALAVGELAAKLRMLGDPARAEAAVPIIQSNSMVHDVTVAHCVAGARNRMELRAQNPNASLADGIMAALAHELNATLLSGDSAFRRRPASKAA